MVTGEQRASPLKDLDLYCLDTVLPAQPYQLRTLIARQTLLRALVDIGLTHPVAQARIRNPQITCYLCVRLAAESYQVDRTLTKLQWMCDRHEDSLPENGANRLRIGVRTTGSGSESFNLHFANFDIRIAPEDVVIGSRRTIYDERGGWRIAYRADSNGTGMPSREFYATNRWTNDRHVRIWADGHTDHLDTISEIFFHDPEKPDSGAEEFRTRNEAVARQLRDRGLYPPGV